MTPASRPGLEPLEEGDRGRPILLFDGVCNLCNRTIDFVIRRDRWRQFRFAPLQGLAAASLGLDTTELDSVVLVEDGRVSVQSTAIGRVLRRLGGGWSVLGSLLLLIPRPVRDAGYRFVGNRRYRWWGRRDTCRVPTPEERARFLD